MATNMGVSRFDGRTFVNYDVQNGLPENTVFEIYEDESERLWFISFPFQLSYFYNDSIYQYKYNYILESIAGHGMIPIKKSFQADEKDNVIFSFLNGSKLYKIDDFGNLTTLEEITKDTISVVVTKSKGQLLAAQNSTSGKKEFTLYIKTKEKPVTLTVPKYPSKYSGGYFLLDQTKKGDLLFAHNELLVHIFNDGKYIVHNLKDRILWINVEDDGTLWVGKEFSGVDKYNSDLIHLGPSESYLKGISVSSVLVDNEGGVWYTSLGNGVFYRPTKAFTSYTSSDGLSGINVKAVAPFKGKLYLGFDDSYFLDVIEEGKLKNIEDFGNDRNKVKVLNTFNDKVLWIGTETHLHSYNNKEFHKIYNNHPILVKQSIYSNFVFSTKYINPIDSASVLLGQMRSLSIVKKGKVVYDSYLDDSIALRIESIKTDYDSSYLLGTFSGLYRLKDNNFSFLGEASELLSQRIIDIVIIGKHQYVLGTKGSGLVISLPDTIFQITHSQGLSSNSISSILITGNDLWVATNNGLNLLKLDELRSGNPKIIVFKKENGLISNEINQIKGDSNFIYIATNGGLTIFDRRKYQPFINPPPVYIHGVNIMDQSTAIAANYDLGYDQNFIRISYAGISFRDAGDLLYKYKLIGLSNDKWVYTKNIEVEYAFLPPGNYRFEVFAINSEGLVSSTPATINFIIHPPFWKTWWFKTLMAIVTLILIFSAVRMRMQEIKRKHAMQSDIIRYRQQSLLRQMDPHFVFNTLNSIQSFIIKNESKVATIYISKFSRLMRLILTNSQKQTVRLSNEINALNLYLELESMRFKEKFEYSITHDSSVVPDMCFIPAFIVQPFIENAIWHGIMPLDKAGKINVNFEKDGEQLICTVEDNGVGRDSSARNKSDFDKGKESLGISIVETRLELLSQYYGVEIGIRFTDLLSEDQIPIGTRVAVNLPLVK